LMLGFFVLKHYCLILPLLILALTGAGCAGSMAPSADPVTLTDPIRVQSTDLAVTLIRIAAQGDKETLVEDPGWREYGIEIENISKNTLIVRNVKLLGQDGAYVDSASAYEQIIAPPDADAELAGDVAEKAAGIAAGQIIPFGGQILGVLSGAVSATSAEARANAKRTFGLRVLKNVELAPAGKVERSAFLPNIARAKVLVVDYALDAAVYRIDLPLPIQP
jgi:ethanolamine utilization microcompartment shell protein EutS